MLASSLQEGAACRGERSRAAVESKERVGSALGTSQNCHLPRAAAVYGSKAASDGRAQDVYNWFTSRILARLISPDECPPASNSSRLLMALRPIDDRAMFETTVTYWQASGTNRDSPSNPNHQATTVWHTVRMPDEHSLTSRQADRLRTDLSDRLAALTFAHFAISREIMEDGASRCGSG
jgi:hypothetical protein